MKQWWEQIGIQGRLALACGVLFIVGLGAWGVARLWQAHTAASARTAWTHDAYIWQLQWTDSLRSAIHNQRDVVHAWRVLATQVRADGSVRTVPLDAGALRAIGRPVVVVVRIEGQLAQFDAAMLQRVSLDALARARVSGLQVAGLEIDHDCASAKLPRYTAFLQGLRAALSGGTALSITALPTWLNAAGLPALLAEVDLAVLQVHAVQNPSRGLFDPALALRWAQAFDAVSPKPFRLALPTYGSRVHFDALGNYTDVESEAPSLKGPGSGTELMVMPHTVTSFLAEPALTRLHQLQGFAWFRLPTAQDQRAWHANTWRAVLTGAPLSPQAQVQAAPSTEPQVFDVVLANVGTTDLPWPRQITLPAHCTQLDGGQGFEAVPPAMGGPHFQNTQARLLAPQGRVRIGWARCATSPEKEIHVLP